VKLTPSGLSESLARELVPFNIRVLIVQPGAFRTNFLIGSTKTKVGMSEPYKGSSVEQTLKYMDNLVRLLTFLPCYLSYTFPGTICASLNRFHERTVLTPSFEQNGTQRGDPDKAAARIFEVVMGTGMARDEGVVLEETGLLRLPLGKDCLDRFETKMGVLKENFERVTRVALSTDLDA
jgi:hypothetical protein